MSSQTIPNSAQRMFAQMVKRDAAGLYKFLRHFAEVGDVEVLRDALEARVPQQAAQAGIPVIAVVGALNSVRDGQDYSGLISAWKIACGSPGQEVLDELLASAQDSQCALDLMSLGANPNGWTANSTGSKRTPLAAAVGRGQTAIARVLLEALAEKREVPHFIWHDWTPGSEESKKSLFDILGYSTLSRGDWSAESSIMDELRDFEIPREWSLEMGRVLKEASSKPSFGKFEPLVTVPRALLLASFDDAQSWYEILRSSSRVVNFMIENESTHGALTSIIDRALSDGAKIDEIPSLISLDGTDNYVRVTLLQNVVLQDCAGMTKALIDLGANVDYRLPDLDEMSEGLRGTTLIEAAASFGCTEVEQILSAAAARKRIEEIVGRGRHQNREVNP